MLDKSKTREHAYDHLHPLKKTHVDLGGLSQIVLKSLTNRLAIVGVLLAHFRILKTSGVGNDPENYDFLSEFGPLYCTF